MAAPRGDVAVARNASRRRESREAALSGRVDRREALLGAAGWMGAAALSPARSAARASPVPPALRRGFNLPDQAPRRHDAAVRTEDLKRLRALGMTHVRLPVVTEAVLSDFSGPATRGAALDDLEAALNTLLGLGYCVSVDLHSERDFSAMLRETPEKAQQALWGGWRDLAKRLATWPAQSIFAELLNEPAAEDRIWRPYAEDLARDIRSLLPKTTFVVGPAPYQRVEALARWTPFADRNVVYAAHYYDPMIFTHQGLTWDPESPYAGLAGVPFPLPRGSDSWPRLLRAAERRGDTAAVAELQKAKGADFTPATISDAFDELANWSALYSAPVIVNEFGALRFKSSSSDRLAWLAAVRGACEAHGFGWAHWSYAGGFGLTGENGALDEGVIRVLLPGR